MKTLIVSSAGACGIAEHTAMLMDAVRQSGFQGPDDVYSVNSAMLDPAVDWPYVPDVLHLNYHAALHSRWQPETIHRAQGLGCKVLVTYHDSGVPNSEQCKAICEAADWFVIHEPYRDLPAHGEYLRMGVQDWLAPWVFDTGSRRTPAPVLLEPYPYVALGGRPVLGTVGFPFPWKCYDELAKITAQCGWGLLLIAPGATEDDWRRWQGLNQWIHVLPSFTDREMVQRLLAACDATAFTYVTHNTGQSGAILQGIAARKPVIALSTCRQFRALYGDPLGASAVRWAGSFEDVVWHLQHMSIERVAPAIVALAEQESWTKVGQRYAAIYNQLGGRS